LVAGFPERFQPGHAFVFAEEGNPGRHLEAAGSSAGDQVGYLRGDVKLGRLTTVLPVLVLSRPAATSDI